VPLKIATLFQLFLGKWKDPLKGTFVKDGYGGFLITLTFLSIPSFISTILQHFAMVLNQQEIMRFPYPK
jgi:hypothetical protein